MPPRVAWRDALQCRALLLVGRLRAVDVFDHWECAIARGRAHARRGDRVFEGSGCAALTVGDVEAGAARVHARTMAGPAPRAPTSVWAECLNCPASSRTASSAGSRTSGRRRRSEGGNSRMASSVRSLPEQSAASRRCVRRADRPRTRETIQFARYPTKSVYPENARHTCITTAPRLRKL